MHLQAAGQTLQDEIEKEEFNFDVGMPWSTVSAR